MLNDQRTAIVTIRPALIDSCISPKRVGWTGDDLSLWVEARTVAGAIPGFLRSVPVHNAAQMGAHGRAFVNGAASVPVDGKLGQTSPQYRSLASRNVVDRRNVTAAQPVLG